MKRQFGKPDEPEVKMNKKFGEIAKDGRPGFVASRQPAVRRVKGLCAAAAPVRVQAGNGKEFMKDFLYLPAFPSQN
jgi:hypothetical protein